MKRFFRKVRNEEAGEANTAGSERPLRKDSIPEIDKSHTSTGTLPFYDLGQLKRNLDVARESAPVPAAEEEEAKLSPVAEENAIFGEASGSTKKVFSDRYVIHDQIGKGGTAVVYRATDRVMNRIIAFKQFHKSVDEENTNYLAEIETISKISHPNVVVTHDAGEREEGSFIVMNLIEGMNLEQAIKKQGAYGLKTFKQVALQALEGLSEIHSQGIVHLDIKPSNIMVTHYKSGSLHVQIVDFGSAKHVDDEGVIPPQKKNGLHGSIHTMSPETFKNLALDLRSDIYSMGCVFYEMLTGNKPFSGDSAVMIMADHLQNRYEKLGEVLPGLPNELAEAIGQMLAAERDDRPASVQEIISKFKAIDGL